MLSLMIMFASNFSSQVVFELKKQRPEHNKDAIDTKGRVRWLFDPR